MARSIKGADSDIVGNITTDKLTSTGLFSPQAGTENIIGYTILSSGTNLADSDALYMINTNGITINLPATSTSGRFIQFIPGRGVSFTSVTIGRNGNTINDVAENLTIDLTTAFFCVYNGSTWTVQTY
jgi:hypothetical protein